MHPITTKENRLFRRWKDKWLFKDGLPSPEGYLASKPKTLLLFRQANAKGKSGDLRDFDSIEGNLRFWRRVSSWCYGLRNITRGATRTMGLWHDWERRRNDLTFIKSTLGPFGFINLDKVGARGTSSKARMKEVAEEKGKLIKQQLEFYQPDVIIACGLGELFDLLRGIIDSQGEAVIKLGKRKFQEVRLSGRPVYLVESYHPAQRGNTYDAFAEVVGSFRQVAKNIV